MWLNLSELLTIGAPSLNPGGQYVSGSSDVTGTTTTIQNTQTDFNLSDYVWWNQGLTSAFMPFWNKATHQLLIRGTIITRPDINARMNVGVIFWDTFFTGLNGRGGLYSYSSWAGGDCWMGNTLNEGVGDLCTNIPDPSLRMVVVIGKNNDDPNAMGPTNIGVWASNPTGAYLPGDPAFMIIAGSKTNTSSGPHTTKILWEYALMEYV